VDNLNGDGDAGPEYFIDHFARKAGKSFRGINKKTLNLLLSYRWPGHIRELQKLVERSVIVCETENFSVDELFPQSVPAEPKSTLELPHARAAQEREMIEVALRESGGRVSGPSGAAAKLGIHRSTLESKIASLKINQYRFKTASASKNSSACMATQKNISENDVGTFGNCRGLDIWQAANPLHVPLGELGQTLSIDVIGAFNLSMPFPDRLDCCGNDFEECSGTIVFNAGVHSVW
jgi:hypothetical protein